MLRCLLGGPNARVIKQEYEVVAIPRALLLGTSEVNILVSQLFQLKICHLVRVVLDSWVRFFSSYVVLSQLSLYWNLECMVLNLIYFGLLNVVFWVSWWYRSSSTSSHRD